MPQTSKMPQEVSKALERRNTPVILKSKISTAFPSSIVTADDQNSKLKGKRIFLKDSQSKIINVDQSFLKQNATKFQ